MSRDREAGAPPTGTLTTDRPAATPRPPHGPGLRPSLPAAAWALLVVLSLGLPAALAWRAAALPTGLAALAMLLATVAAAGAGAAWAQGRTQAHLREALHDALQDAQQLQALLSQMQSGWQWQTDAQHRLTHWQPPAGAPPADWRRVQATIEQVGPAWQHFHDAAGSLRQRMAAQAPLQHLRVHPTGTDRGSASAEHPAPAHPAWQLSALPRWDAHGTFTGYRGVAEPLALQDALADGQRMLGALLTEGPGHLGWLTVDAAGDWHLQAASPALRGLLGLAPGAPVAGPWAQHRQALPEHLPQALRQALEQPQAGPQVQAGGWAARWLPLQMRPQLPSIPSPPTSANDPAAPGPGLLLVLVQTGAGPDPATQALAAEHAAFSYTISHDLRAPIRVVEGFGRILKEDYGAQLDRIGRDHLDRVVSAAARMNQMIDALLSLSQLSTQPLARQPVNLSQLAGYVVDELRRAQPDSDRERAVNVHIAPQLACIGDPTLLRMLLENLLGNAWKYSAKQATAEIRFEQIEQAGRRVYRVRDNGAGFDMRFADRLFGVFQRLHSASDFQGTGVGLASVRRIVRRHGGEIWAESEVGHGASFYFTLQA